MKRASVTPRLLAAAGGLAALALLAACSQEPVPSATSPKASAVVPSASTTAAGPTSSAAPSTTVVARDPNIRTLDDVRATLTADGTVDVNQADCVVTSMVGAIGDAGTIDVFAIGDLTKTDADRRAAAQAAFEQCIPKKVLLRPIGLGVQEAAKTRGVAITDVQVDCITAQLAAVVSYDDLLSGPSSDGTGGIPESVASLAVRMCVPPETLTQLGLS